MPIVDPFFIGGFLVGLALLKSDQPRPSQPRAGNILGRAVIVFDVDLNDANPTGR